ncbi:MAG: ATP-binding protein [bacterium]
MGAAMREIAADIQKRIEQLPDRYDADKLTRMIRSVDLQRMGWEIVDINVTDVSGIVIASLTGQANGTQMREDDFQRVTAGQMMIRYPPDGYYGHWVIEYNIPYIIDIPSYSPNETPEIGSLQIMFSTQEIIQYYQKLRMERLFYFAIVTITLTIFINPLTSYLIVRRLERMMEAVSAVQAGDLATRIKDSSMDEIGRLGRSFNRMIEHISSEHANRMKALGNLAAGVAHEVRNPLNSISITIQYLKDILSDNQNNGEAQECLDVIARQVKELDRIVEEFLQLARPAEMNLNIVDLNSFISELMLDYISILEVKNIELIKKIDNSCLFVKIDKDKFKQAISNIVLNAIQAMPNGGILSISVSEDKLENKAVIDISDTGIGISQENIERLFEPYFTTKPEGTGLGLSIAYKIIEAHNGKITAISEEGKGSTFSIVLPLKGGNTTFI